MYNKSLREFWFVCVVNGYLLFGVPSLFAAQPVDPGNLGKGQPWAANDKKNEPKAKYAPGRFIVKFKSEGPNAVTGDAQSLLESNQPFQASVADGLDSLDKLNQKHKVKNARSLFVERKGLTTADATRKQNNGLRSSMAMHQARSQRAPKDAVVPDLSNIYVLEVAPESNIETIVQEYQADPHVEYAQPDYIMETNMVPNDPYYSSYGSWGQNYDDLWGLKKIQAEQAWDITQGEGIVVAVVDTGLDYNHPDIAANVWANPGEIPSNGIDDDGNGFVDDVRGWNFSIPFSSNNNSMDGHGHGTHVSGTIAAVGNNGIGIVGVAPKVKIMPIKGLDDQGSGWSFYLAQGILYAAQNGADVINNSWGCGGTCPSNPAVEDAVRTAYALGVVVVFAAGNDSADVFNYSPQNMTDPKPIVVSASTQVDTVAYFSNQGAFVDVAAPGGQEGGTPPNYEPLRNILSIKAATTDPGMDGNGNLVVGGDYLRQAGTSMAAPHVAGLAALVLANRLDFTNEDVRKVIRVSADDIGAPGSDWKAGAGRINAARALTITSVPSAKIITPANGTNCNPGQFVTITGTAAGANFKQYELFYGGGVNPSSWVSLGPPTGIPVQEASLGNFLVPTPLAPDTYAFLKLVVTLTSGVRFEDVVGVGITSSKVRQITANTFEQGIPDISGNFIVWMDNRNDGGFSNWDIYLYDLTTNTERPITTATSSVQGYPRVSGNRVVWHDNRNGNWDIYFYDLTTNTERQITADASWQEYPAISGDKIVWMDDRNGDQDIYLYDLSTDTERQITTDILGQWVPVIEGNFIVWTDNRNGNWDIYLYDLTTNTERQITTDPSDQINPAISGNLIVWEDYRNDKGDIYLYDLTTNTVRRITTDPWNQWGPRISENKIVWNDDRNGETDIYFYDLATNVEKPITINPSYEGLPVISGNSVAWMDWRHGDWDIYFYPLENPIGNPPVLNPIGNKTIKEGELLSFDVVATDPDGDALTYRVEQSYANATFSGQTFTWKPISFFDSGTYKLTFTVSDGTYVDGEIVTITVTDVPFPDIVMASLSTATGPVASGETITIFDTVWDQSNFSVDTIFTIAFSFSKDQNYGGSDDIPFAETRSVTSIIAGSISSGSTAVIVPSTALPGNYYVCASADSGATVTEGNELNNSGCTINPVEIVSPAPDLILSALSKTTGPVAPGGSFSVSNTAANQGMVSAGAFAVGFVLSGDAVYGGTDDIVLTAARSVASLAAGATSAASTTVTVPAATAFGNYYVCAMADKDASVVESDETNNSRCTTTPIQVAPADLVMTVVSAPATAVTGTAITISNTVKNQGNAAAGAFNVRLYGSPDATITTADTVIGTRSMSGLSAGASSSANAVVTIPTNFAPGTYYIGAIADYANTVMESDETNNVSTAQPIVLTAGPDLVMTAVSGPSSAVRGTSVAVSNAVTNQGVGKVTNSSTVGLYLSQDSVITTADTRVGTRTISSLAAGITSTVSTAVAIPSTLAVGTYYIGAIADYTNTVKENNEINNAMAGNTIVVQ